jgi:hypothetical protein
MIISISVSREDFNLAHIGDGEIPGREGLILEHSEEWHEGGITYAYISPASDIDQDGTMEIVTVGWYEDGTTWVGGNVRQGIIQIWTWNGSMLELEHEEKWTASGNYLTRLIKWGAIADVDDDGVDEIITAGQTYRDAPIYQWQAELALWTWNGISFELEHVKRWHTTSATEIYDVNVCDVDDDDVNEIITLGIYWLAPTHQIYGSQMRIWNWNGATLTLEHSEETYDASLYFTSQRRSALMDIDQDGTVEIIVAGYLQQKQTPDLAKGKVWIWNWNGKSLTREHSEEWGNFSNTGHRAEYDILTEDFDNDGVVEIVTCGETHSSPKHGSIRIWRWNGSSFTLLHSEKWNSTNNVQVYHSTAMDVNSDGKIELVTGGAANDPPLQGQLRVWRWNITKGLHLLHSKEWAVPGPVNVLGVCVEDVDGDSLQEIITTGWAHDGIRHNGQLRIWYLPVINFYTVNWDEYFFNVKILSNSTVSDFGFSEQPEKQITFNVTVPANLAGFCDVIIPTELLGGPYTCLLDGSPVQHTETSNMTHTRIQTTYTQNGQIQITGTAVIPEFPTIISVTLLLTNLLLRFIPLTRKISSRSTRNMDVLRSR